MSEKKSEEGKLSVKDYERLGRTLESIFEAGYVDERRVFKINFIRGLYFGFGSVIGATLLVAALLSLLGLFQEIPFLGDFVETTKNTVENR